MATHNIRGMNQTVGCLNKVVEKNNSTISQNQCKVSKRTESTETGLYRTEGVSSFVIVVVVCYRGFKDDDHDEPRQGPPTSIVLYWFGCVMLSREDDSHKKVLVI